MEHLRPVTSMQRIEVLEETAYLVNHPLIRRPYLFFPSGDDCPPAPISL